MSDFRAPYAPQQRGLSLRGILPQARFHNASDLTVRSCSGTWNECQPNDLFAALVSADSDGHNDVDRALARGATAVLTERLLPIGSPQCIVEDSRVAYGRIAHALAGNPCSRLTTVAVAGQDGKTSTTHLIHSVLSAAGQQPGMASCPARKKPAPAGDRDWNPRRLIRFLEARISGGQTAALIETSFADLAAHQLAGAAFDAAVVTNWRKRRPGGAGQPHAKLVRHLKPDGVAVVNVDDPLSATFDDTAARTLTVGIRESAAIRGRILESTICGQTFSITAGHETILVKTTVPGAAHVYNCLQAAAVGVHRGIDMGTIGRGLEQFQGLPGRLSAVRCGQAFSVIVDEARTAFRLGAALNMMRRHVSGRLLCVFSPPAHCSPDSAARFGRTAERGCDVPVITRPQLAPSLDLESDHQVLDGFQRPAGAHVIPDRITAIEWVLARARPGDAVLIAGMGEHSICSLAADRWQLTDTDVCQAWLYGDTSVNQTIVSPVVNPQIFRIDDYRPC